MITFLSQPCKGSPTTALETAGVLMKFMSSAKASLSLKMEIGAEQRGQTTQEEAGPHLLELLSSTTYL